MNSLWYTKTGGVITRSIHQDSLPDPTPPYAHRRHFTRSRIAVMGVRVNANSFAFARVAPQDAAQSAG